MISNSITNAGIDLINKGIFSIAVSKIVKNAKKYSIFLGKDTNKLMIRTIVQRKKTTFPNRHTLESKIQFVVTSVCPNTPEYFLIPIMSSESAILLDQKYSTMNNTVSTTVSTTLSALTIFILSKHYFCKNKPLV
jgi:hypothetical protein